MRYINLFLLGVLLSVTSPSFAMERGGGGRDFNRGGGQDWHHHDNENWNRHHNNEWGGGNVYVAPETVIQGGSGYNNNPFPDDAESNQIYQEDLPN